MNITFCKLIYADSYFCYHGACSVCIDWAIYLLLFVFYSVSFSGLGVRRRFGSSGPVLIINDKGDNNWQL